MNDPLAIFMHPVFLSAVFAWILAQCTKVALDLIQKKSFDGDFFLRSGGMPSSHSAFVSALTFALYLYEGASTIFVVALCFSLIVLSDALGVRRQVGHQATLLNILIKELKPVLKKRISLPGVIKELVGHSGAQVVVGCLLGAVVALTVHILSKII